MEELVLAFVAGCVSGAYGMRYWFRRPRKVKHEDRDAGLRRYQALKNG